MSVSYKNSITSASLCQDPQGEVQQLYYQGLGTTSRTGVMDT